MIIFIVFHINLVMTTQTSQYTVTASGNYKIKVFQYGEKIGDGDINLAYTYTY